MEQTCTFELETYQPENEKLFCVNILLCIGIDDASEAADYFDLTVCSLEWLKLYESKPNILRHTMIIDRYNFKKIKSYINLCIDKCEGESWEEIGLKLSRYFSWEYEDYDKF